MYVRNFGGYRSTTFDYENFTALRKDGNYWFPHFCKWITWAIIVAVVVTSCTILILYGLSFGLIKFYLWVTAFLTSFFISVFLTAPIRLFAFSIINTIFRRVRPVILQRRVHFSLLMNSEDLEKKIRVLKFRKYNAHLYTPIPERKLESRLEDVKYNIELRNLTTDIIAYSFFMLTVFYIVLYDKTPMIFYSNEVIKDLVLNGSHGNSAPFKDIVTNEKFVKYLNETLLPALLLDADSKNGRPKRHLRRKRRLWDIIAEHTKKPPDNLRKRQILDDFNDLRADDAYKNVFSKGWTANPNFKLMGKPRLRQIRVKSGICKELETLEVRNLECAEDLTMLNIERGTFSLNWEPTSPKGLTDSQALPWRYQSMWETKTMPIFGKFSVYPAGGYVLDLARNMEDSRIVLDFMNTFQWVDFKTRAIFVEFAVYCVNTNLFTVVTLIAEKPAVGYIIPSYQINTCKLLFLDTKIEMEILIMTILFAFLLFFFFLRESVRIHRTSLKLYLTQGFAVLDLAIVLLGVLCTLFLILRYIYVTSLLKELEQSQNNKFVSFILAVFWHSLSIYIEALLVCLASFKLFRLLTFRVIFYQFQTTLSQCYKHYIDLVSLLLVLIFAFALFFNLALVNYSGGFSTFRESLNTMIGRTVALDNSFDFSLFSNTPWYLGPLFFAFFVSLCAILFVNMFIAVVCLYFHKIRNVPLQNKYNVFEYMKHAVTAKRQKDILHLDEDKFFGATTALGGVMRLKGGGNKMSRRKNRMKRLINYKDRVCNEYFKSLQIKEELELEDRQELWKLKLTDFVIKKPYDTTNYRDLAEDRAIAIKNFVLMYLTEDMEAKRVLREKALKALFLSYTMSKRNLEDIPGDYFIVEGEHGQQVYDKARFSKIKKVIEDVGREKNILITEDIHNIEMSAVEEKLDELKNKLNLLCRKFRLK